MMNNHIQIRIIADGEGLLLYKTLRNALESARQAMDKGANFSEWEIVSERQDEQSKRVIKEFKDSHPEILIMQRNSSDLGHKNRSHGTDTKYIAIIQAGELISSNYFLEMYKTAEKFADTAVYYPAFTIGIGPQGRKYIQKNSGVELSRVRADSYHSIGALNGPVFVRNDILNSSYKKPKFPLHFLNEGYSVRIANHAISFVRGEFRAVSGVSKWERGVSGYFSPSYYKNLQLEAGSNSKHSINAEAEDSLLTEKIKKSIQLQPALYRYLREQYHLNRWAAGTVLSFARRQLLSVVNAPGHPPRMESIEDISLPAPLRELGFGADHARQLGLLNSIEPIIRPSYEILAQLEIVNIQSDILLDDSYLRLCQELGSEGFTDLLLTPHLIRGGADLATIHLIKSLSRSGQRVLVISTAGLESPWGHMVKKLPGVVFIELHKYIVGATELQKQIFVLRIIQNWSLERITVINSLLGYDILRYYPDTIPAHIRVFLHTYAFDMSIDGYIFNVIENGLIDVYDSVDKYVTDSGGYKKQLIEVNGFDESRINCLYLPIESKVSPRVPYGRAPSRKVLWASRISSAKLVEVAVDIGRMLARYNIELHFYGALDAEYEQGGVFRNMIQAIDNIHYHGKYDGFESINHTEYDLFLLTSKNEGMPNVVLESIMANMFVVAPAVGGIPEVVEEGVNGYLVKKNFAPDEYFEKIISYYDNYQKIESEVKAELNSSVVSRHSLSSYDGMVQQLYKKN